jgi:hypothetical protein
MEMNSVLESQRVPQPHKKFLYFKEFSKLLMRSEVSARDLSPDSVEFSSSHPRSCILRTVLILSPHLRLDLPSDSVLQVFPPKIVTTFGSLTCVLSALPVSLYSL